MVCCYICKQEAAHYSEEGGGALICDECLRDFKFFGGREPDDPGITPVPPKSVTVRMEFSLDELA